MKNKIWPPKAYKHGSEAPDKESNIDGEGSWIYLRRFENDGTLKGRIWTSCCDCGLEHLYIYNVVRLKSGDWWLIKTPYRDYKTGKKFKKGKS